MSDLFEHYCHCGKWGSFGSNDKYYCREHHPNQDRLAGPKPSKSNKSTSNGATESTAEAMAVLEANRAEYIVAARQIARELIQQRGETHSREVLEVMFERGLLKPGIPDYWLGAVFRPTEFKWTGRWVTPPVPGGSDSNIHAWRPVKIWTL